MIYHYDECIKKYGNDYKLKKALKQKEIFLIEKGLYSDNENNSDKDIINAKYPNSVYTGESAFYYHGLTDVIPDNYTLATKRKGTRIKDKNIKQVFIKDELFNLGITASSYNGEKIKLYDKERMLIELIRLRAKFPYDYYKEIINSYRNIVNEIDFYKLEGYAKKFKNGNKIMEAIQKEVI